MRPALMLAAAYLAGSIPFGYLVVRARGGGDVREAGSGGTGATNVTRRAGKWAGVVTLALDALKGAAAVLLAREFLAPDGVDNWWVAACAVASIVGHCFPVWLKFRGGKGVATGLGVFLALSPTALLPALAAFALVVWRTRYVSLGSITAAALVPVSLYALDAARDCAAPCDNLPRLAAATAGAFVVILMHRANIGRLLSGTENKLKL